MSHLALKSGYTGMVERLNRFPQGAPPSETLYKVLRLLLTEREAALVALMPIKPFTAKKASAIWKMDLAEATRVLDGLARRAMLVDVFINGEMTYTLPPPMTGFFEFAMMRTRGDIDQKLLSELLHQYLHVEEDFMRELVGRGDTQLGRIFVHEPVLSAQNAVQVLDYERATEVIKTSRVRGISTCYCRHKAMHLGKNCAAPLQICMTFSAAGESLTRHGYAREVEVSESLGCGVCARTCDKQGITLRSREKRVVTPVNAVHRVVLMAIERGNFQDLLFDNRVLWNHRALAAVLGVVLRLPPVKQVMASQQVKSRYMEYVATHVTV